MEIKRKRETSEVLADTVPIGTVCESPHGETMLLASVRGSRVWIHLDSDGWDAADTWKHVTLLTCHLVVE